MSHEKQCLLQDNEAERTKLLSQKPVPFKYEGTIRVFQANKNWKFVSTSVHKKC